ncbi:hypothetical protein GCM10010412_022170 [Nonomuraea recticatena]|uniref:PIN like domain-containing protein n=1 Tax=Nonomuraea recticatena TaxID=46178 RepID=A0ABP6DYA7_9ACTN
MRGRAGAIKGRIDELTRAPREVTEAFEAAWRQVSGATSRVKKLLEDYAGSEGAAELDELITKEEFTALTDSWRSTLLAKARGIKDEDDFGAATFSEGSDTLLPQIAALFGDAIGEPPSESELKERVEHATAFRFPNKVPPGFSDLGKGTELSAAGDYLLWEELIQHARSLPDGARVILASRDGKEDWYQAEGFGNSQRPWPDLIDEFERRTNSRLLLVGPAGFYAGIREFLGAEIASSTIDELNRPAPQDEEEQLFVSPKDLAGQDPPEELVLDAYRSAGLSSNAIRQALGRPSDRLFQWWLIGTTRDLGIRPTREGEPLFDLQAVLKPEAKPGPGWLRASDIVRSGEFPYLSMFIAPWFASILQISPQVDRTILLRLAHRHGSATGFGAPDQAPT